MSASEVPDELLRLIRYFEGLRLSAYQDSVGVWTIGYGHTEGVRRGMKITEEEAERYLRQDAAKALNDTMTLCPVLRDAPVGKLIAITDFTYNFGAGRLRASTLRRLINEGEWEKVPAELQKWVWARDKETGEMEQLPGLIKRRKAEVLLWIGESHEQKEAPRAKL